MTWTSKRTEYMLRRWREGASGARIAEELGVTRNAILGALYRARKQYGEEVVPQRVPERGNRGSCVAREPKSAPSPPADTAKPRDAASAPRSAPQPKPKPEPPKQRAKPRAQPKPAPPKPALRPALPDPVHVSVAMPPRAIVNLGKYQCRYPIGEVPGHPGRHVFCAEPVLERLPYCAACALIVYSDDWWDKRKRLRQQAEKAAGAIPAAAE